MSNGRCASCGALVILATWYGVVMPFEQMAVVGILEQRQETPHFRSMHSGMWSPHMCHHLPPEEAPHAPAPE